MADFKKILNFAGKVGLSVAEEMSKSARRTAKSRQRDKRFNDEQRAKWAEAENAYNDVASNIHEFKESHFYPKEKSDYEEADDFGIDYNDLE